ncbi:hypothetical protein BJY16_003802 [Actinoplanes octamycinicus]|uniref:DUF4352 domain-containing protein n=1 Tax=Actinoplanes octamycinicus TaxID=135948 RepID=A0A7W7M7Z6_9ACTN|nr:DUF4352 domain-containing protein [Actinoplanes octamycinicus]MBB4740343.1 hypothetical protein [Actinoplanes octamycinicus]GIE62582.1 Mpr protein [Actinoplanes octamycinicus]
MSHDLRQHRRPIRPARPVSKTKVSLAVLVAVAAVVALFAAGIVAEQYSRKQPAAATADTPAQAGAAPPGLGAAVRDGRFEFVVTRVDCSHTTIGVEHLKRTAAGKYCVVSLSVRNVGDGAKYFVGHAQKAYDAAGTEYGSDELAGVYANRGAEAFLQKVEPGEKATGKLVFDVPKKVKLTSLRLHDSLLSGGVTVALGG